jgi:hypothetical protein
MHATLNLIAQSHAAGWFAGIGGLFLIVAILLSVFWIWTMIDCLSSSLPTGEKVMWFFVILFLHIVGSIVYMLVARPGHHGRGHMVT